LQPIAASDELEALRAGDEAAFAGRVTPEDLSPEAERELLAAFRSWHSE
jgi:hypothetical protein